MKTLKIHLRMKASILILLMLFQSCTVYKKTTITLPQAVQNETIVKVKTKSENLKFTRVGIENGNYYGVKKMDGEIVKIPLEPQNILSIKEKDQSMSTILTVALPVTIVLGVLVIIASTLDFGLGS